MNISKKLKVGVLGGVVLLWMGAGLLRGARAQVADDSAPMPMDQSSPLVAGLVLSAANPYLLVWWATVGTVLIMRAGEFGVLAVVVLAVAHWTCECGACAACEIVMLQVQVTIFLKQLGIYSPKLIF